MSDLMQSVTITLGDGRKAVFSGHVQVVLGDIITDIVFGHPKPLPEGCRWESPDESETRKA